MTRQATIKHLSILLIILSKNFPVTYAKSKKKVAKTDIAIQTIYLSIIWILKNYGWNGDNYQQHIEATIDITITTYIFSVN